MTCRACGDPVGDLGLRSSRLRHVGLELCEAEWRYCRECADELFRGVLWGTPADLGSGGNLWSAPEPDPGQENAIRIMEDRGWP